MKVIASIAIGQGKYTAQDGTEKTRWMDVGRILERDNGGQTIKIDCLPLTEVDRDGNTRPWSGWLQVFPKRDDAPRQAAPQQRPMPTGGDFDDQIPF